MKKSKKGALRWIIRSSKSQLFNIIFLAVVYGLNAFVGVYNTVFAKDLIDAATKSHDMNAMIYNGLMYLGVTVFQIITLILARNFLFKISAKTELTMKSKLFNDMMQKDYAHITAYHSGELMNLLTSDIGVVSSAITTIIPNVVFFIIKLIGVIYILLSIDVIFSLVFIFGGLLVFLASSLFKPVTKRMHKRVQETDGKVRSFMQEGLSSLLMIKTFDAQDKMSDSADKLQQENYEAKRKRNIFSIATGTAVSAVFAFAFVWGLGWGSYMLYYGLISYGVLTQIITLIGQIRTPIQGISNIFPTYFNALASAERIMEIEELPDEEVINHQIDVSKMYSEMREIRFDDITFSFDRDKVLEATSLTVKKGAFVAIEGISGIGKSTLLKLLLSVYQPQNGEIVIRTDGRDYPVDRSTRKLFSYVPQGNFLLSGTLRENVAFVAPNATDEEILEAARIACADEFIAELPEGLDTVIAERGGGLSEGQVQRIAIARAILSGAPILLLDEATSALDEATEERLLKNLRELENITCIIISHKKAAEQICDKIVTISDKKIKEK